MINNNNNKKPCEPFPFSMVAITAQSAIRDFQQTCEEWEASLQTKYPTPTTTTTTTEISSKKDDPSSTGKSKFRQYDEAPQRVKDFYRENHARQTLDFGILLISIFPVTSICNCFRSDISRSAYLLVLQQKKKYEQLHFGSMGIWEALEELDKLVDEVLTLMVSRFPDLIRYAV